MNILSKTYNRHQIIISVDFLLDETIYINATKVAKHFNKFPADWLKTKETKEYIEAISHYENIHNGDLVVIRKGGNDLSLTGTWIHKKLIIAFARWLSPDFAVWCDLTIEDILKSSFQTQEPLTPQVNCWATIREDGKGIRHSFTKEQLIKYSEAIEPCLPKNLFYELE